MSQPTTDGRPQARLMLTCTVLCLINMAFHEQVLRMAPNCSNWISFVQHLFITGIGLLKLNDGPSQVPIRHYLPLVFLNFAMILTNNISINNGVSVPLNMIFKSSSLVANMLLGMLLLRHRYPLNKFISIMLITGGLILCTLEDYRLKHSLTYGQIYRSMVEGRNSSSSTRHLSTTTDDQRHLFGIAMLTISFLLSAGTGIYQEYMSKNFRKNPTEALFYVHMLSLPIFMVTCPGDLWQQGRLFFRTDAETVHLWLFLSLTVICQYLCVRTVYELTTRCSSLAVTLCLTNRKFLSLMISIFYFGNPFTWLHWFGAMVVFGGTAAFYLVDALRMPKTETMTTTTTKKKKSPPGQRPTKFTDAGLRHRAER